MTVCGGCRCEEGYSGRRCECGGDGDDSASDRCEKDGEGKVCGGHGQCKCGRCICDKEHVGENCECLKDDVSEKFCSFGNETLRKILTKPIQRPDVSVCLLTNPN